MVKGLRALTPFSVPKEVMLVSMVSSPPIPEPIKTPTLGLLSFSHASGLAVFSMPACRSLYRTGRGGAQERLGECRVKNRIRGVGSLSGRGEPLVFRAEIPVFRRNMCCGNICCPNNQGTDSHILTSSFNAGSLVQHDFVGGSAQDVVSMCVDEAQQLVRDGFRVPL